MRQKYSVRGGIYDDRTRQMKPATLYVQISNDGIGKTLSIDNGKIMFSVPYEPIEAAMRKEGDHG